MISGLGPSIRTIRHRKAQGIGGLLRQDAERQMNINLSKDELAVLCDLLEQRREELRVEIRRTETPSYQEELRALERTMVALLRRFEKAETTFVSA